VSRKSDEGPERLVSKVPTGRLSRFLQIGATAGRMAAGGALEKAKRVGQGAKDRALPHALLTVKNAEILAARLSRLRGAAMKVGQMLSLEGDSSVPPEFARALEVLRSSAHTMPREQVQSVLADQLGSDFRQRFTELSLEPLAAASIGQVHSAKTLSGESVVLKIQYPGVAESIDSDVDNLRSLLSLARMLPGELDLDAFTAEVKAELHREVDYDRELDQLGLYGAVVGDFPGVRVPKAYPELSSSRVLCMGHAPGVELLEWGKTASQQERDRVGTLLMSLLLRELFVMKRMQTDPNPANYLFDEASGDVVLLDFGAAREVPEGIAEVYLKAFVGLANRDRSKLSEVLSDLQILVNDNVSLREKIIDLSLEAADAFDEGLFDFGTTDLSQRLQERGRSLMAYQKEIKPPPPEFVFFQRKLGGTFLMCRNLRARIDCRALLIEYGVLS